VQYDRARELAQSDAITQDQLDQNRADAEGVRAAVLADSAAVETAQLNLAYCTIRATIPGRTGGLLVKEGNLVRTTDATPLVLVNQMRPVGITFAVPQRYLADIPRVLGYLHAACRRYRELVPLARLLDTLAAE